MKSLPFWKREPPYYNTDPVFIEFDDDMGWIICAVNEGEYEIENLPLPNKFNVGIDWDKARDLAEERKVDLCVTEKFGMWRIKFK